MTDRYGLTPCLFRAMMMVKLEQRFAFLFTFLVGGLGKNGKSYRDETPTVLKGRV